MAKLTIEQKLYKRKTKKPNFIYGLLGGIWKLFRLLENCGRKRKGTLL